MREASSEIFSAGGECGQTLGLFWPAQAIPFQVCYIRRLRARWSVDDTLRMMYALQAHSRFTAGSYMVRFCCTFSLRLSRRRASRRPRFLSASPDRAWHRGCGDVHELCDARTGVPSLELSMMKRFTLWCGGCPFSLASCFSARRLSFSSDACSFPPRSRLAGRRMSGFGSFVVWMVGFWFLLGDYLVRAGEFFVVASDLWVGWGYGSWRRRLGRHLRFRRRIIQIPMNFGGFLVGFELDDDA